MKSIRATLEIIRDITNALPGKVTIALVGGMQEAEQIEDVPIPVFSKPYLVAMKLQATGYKDYQDIVSLMELMTDEERATTRELARRIGRDKKLERLLSPPPEEEVRENPEEYLY